MNNPPKHILSFFRWFCHPDLVKYIEGDLVELFEEQVKEKGIRKAKWLFAWEVVKLFRPSIIKSMHLPAVFFQRIFMIQYFIKSALKSFIRKPASSVFSFLSFIPAFVACIVLILYITNELSYDNFYTKSDRIYRVSTDLIDKGTASKWAVTQYPLGPAMKSEIPGVEQFVQLSTRYPSILIVDNRSHSLKNTHFTNPAFFDVFDLKILSGNKSVILAEPDAVVLSKSSAERIFKEENPVGKILKNGNNQDLIVTGVFEDLPQNSHLKLDALFSLSNSSVGDINHPRNWYNPKALTYVLLKPNVSLESIRSGLNEIGLNHLDGVMSKYDVHWRFDLMNVEDIYLKSDYDREPYPTGNFDYVIMFIAIAIGLLLIAVANYISLSTALYTKRLHEVGIRRVIGGSKTSLFFQMLAESICFVGGSSLLSFLIVSLLLPQINLYFGLKLLIGNIFYPTFFFSIIGVLAIVVLLTSIYPSIYLGSFKPINSIKGKSVSLSKGKRTRQVIVMAQFAMAIFMLIGVSTIYKQVEYMGNKNLGFSKENLIHFNLSPLTISNWKSLENNLLTNPNVVNVATSSAALGSPPRQGLISKLESEDGELIEKTLNRTSVNYKFLETLSIPLVSGRNFSKDHASDVDLSVLVNESLVKEMNWVNPIGKKIRTSQDPKVPPLTVIGVVQDYHQQPLYKKIAPMIIRLGLSNYSVYVKLNDISEKNLTELETSWDEVNEGEAFNYTPVEQQLAERYEKEFVISRLFLCFSVLVIFISLTALVGLSAFVAHQSIREISIRKVLGASSFQLFFSLNREFIFPILMGGVLGSLVVWEVIGRWFENFAYHIEINPVLFVVMPIVVIVIALMTTSYHTMSVLWSNPARNLKDE